MTKQKSRNTPEKLRRIANQERQQQVAEFEYWSRRQRGNKRKLAPLFAIVTKESQKQTNETVHHNNLQITKISLSW